MIPTAREGNPVQNDDGSVIMRTRRRATISIENINTVRKMSNVRRDKCARHDWETRINAQAAQTHDSLVVHQWEYIRPVVPADLSHNIAASGPYKKNQLVNKKHDANGEITILSSSFWQHSIYGIPPSLSQYRPKLRGLEARKTKPEWLTDMYLCRTATAGLRPDLLSDLRLIRQLLRRRKGKHWRDVFIVGNFAKSWPWSSFRRVTVVVTVELSVHPRVLEMCSNKLLYGHWPTTQTYQLGPMGTCSCGIKIYF